MHFWTKSLRLQKKLARRRVANLNPDVNRKLLLEVFKDQLHCSLSLSLGKDDARGYVLGRKKACIGKTEDG